MDRLGKNEDEKVNYIVIIAYCYIKVGIAIALGKLCLAWGLTVGTVEQYPLLFIQAAFLAALGLILIKIWRSKRVQTTGAFYAIFYQGMFRRNMVNGEIVKPIKKRTRKRDRN